MHLHDTAFWFCAFFLLGVFFISIYGSLAAIFLITAILSLYLFFSRRFYFAFLIWFMAVGAIYYQVFAVLEDRVKIPFDIQSEMRGVITKIESASTKQEIVLKLVDPQSGKIKIITRPYPSFQYGDLLRIEGAIKRPSEGSKNYLSKEGISGTVNFPNLEFIESSRGNPVKEKLLNFRNEIVAIFKKSLPREKAALLSGLTLGAREDFSKELQEKMSLSGTTHIVALSGYNISIIALTIGWIFGNYFSRRVSFYLSVFVITIFVLMTGGEASVVRAAIMGIILLFSKEAERIHSLRNAIIIAAFLMALVNPKVLVFDLGFQLSFAALLGIIYLDPVFRKAFRVEDPGFLNWKKNALATLSAQLAVVPFLLGNFGIFSLTSFLANVLIAEAIPIAMALGFLMAGLGFFSEFLTSAAGLITNLFLSYQFLIIEIFSKFTLPIVTESFGFFAAIAYYSLLTAVVYKFNKN